MEVVCLESLWRKKLCDLGWEARSIDRFLVHWSKNTLILYNRQLAKLRDFCVEGEYHFPNNDEDVLANFLCYLAESTPRPKSQLCSTMAALSCMFDSLDWTNPLKQGRLTKLVDALTKSATLAPMIKTKILPIQPFIELFRQWDGQVLSIKQQRMKALCLLALVLMARPSDFTPQAQVYDSDTGILQQVVLSEEHITFLQNGDMSVQFHGIKNDYSRDGFCVTIPKCDNELIDPVVALRVYMESTKHQRQMIPNRPVFLTLTNPIRPLSSKGVSSVLNDSINLAGLGGMGYSAKCFRPTGATRAIELGIDPDIVRHIGRWRSAEVFEKHYVHNKVPGAYCSDMLSSLN